ncbi:Hypothetical protein HDN1F_37200 [gamma proteobacterium HdN1]|nr:Hypothetical protein HDN1F_37200 [gamma proteobacterium HdN1]
MVALVSIFGAAISLPAWAELFVIVNHANSISSMSASDVERLFLKKTVRFSNGANAEPVAQLENSAPRQAFNRLVLQRDEQQLKYYWSRRMFAGLERPPPVLNTQEDVIKVVSANPDAIGYVTIKPDSDQVRVVLRVKE